MRRFTLPAVMGFTGLFMLALVWASGIQESPKNVEGSLQVSELDWDFGYIPTGVSVTHRFVLKNVGNKPLKIVSVKPACGCTSAPLAKTDLEPGESTDLEVTFNSKNFKGKATKSVAVLTDDSNQVTNLKFSTDVGSTVPTLILEPADVNFDSVPLGQKASRKLKITNNDIQAVNIRLVEVPEKYVDAKLNKNKIGIGGNSELTVNLQGKNSTAGYFNRTVTLEVDGHVDYRVSLPVSATLVDGTNASKGN